MNRDDETLEREKGISNSKRRLFALLEMRSEETGGVSRLFPCKTATKPLLVAYLLPRKFKQDDIRMERRKGFDL